MPSSRTSRCQPHPFNLVEITLALGIVAVGVIAILALFPVGANASRDAIAETYAAEAADELLHLIENQVRQDWTNYVDNLAASYIMDTVPAAGDYADFTIPAGGNPQNSLQTLWMYNGPGPTKRFKVIRYVDRPGGTAGQYDSGIDILDFEGILVLWRSRVNIGGTLLPYSIAVGLNAEVTWPAKVPNYADRQKKLFYLELFNR